MSGLREFLRRATGLSERALNRLIASAPERYVTYHIRKRRGGWREIAQPAYEIKELQRLLISEYLRKLPVHPAATAYVKGASIRDNAQRHAANGPILKYDFKEFFPSITELAWLSYCERHELFSREDAIASGRILFRRPKGGRILRLSIGAPSSPILSNLLMYEFDREITERLAQHSVTYTRYADDLTFSALRTGYLTSVDPILRSVLRKMSAPKLSINEEKTVLATLKYKRQVTGLILTLDKRVSLGRERKRQLRAAIHHYVNGKLSKRKCVELAGTLAFAKDMEPEFYTRMERVYGKDALETLRLETRGYHRHLDPSFQSE